MVADSESDMYDLFEESARLGEKGAQWLVRGKFNRALGTKRKDNSYMHLHESLCSRKSLGTVEFELPPGKDKKRVVRQSVKARRVKLRPPHRSHEQLTPQEITIVLAKETNPPKGEEPIEWFLLTSKEVETFEDAVEIINYYLCRWQIEVFFKVLKSGCKVEQLQLEHVDHLFPCLALYSIIAWRVLFLTMLARQCPELPCSVIFEQCEWQAAYIVAKRKKPPNKPPSIKSNAKNYSSFGGYLGRKNDGPPGATAVWIGIQRTRDFALGQLAMKNSEI